MKIKEFSSATGLPVDTIRFYERQGLLKPKRCEGNAYREFADEDVQTAQDIRAGQALGFTLAEIRRGIELWQDGALDMATKIKLLNERLEKTRRQLAQLAVTESYLIDKIKWVQNDERGPSPFLKL